MLYAKWELFSKKEKNPTERKREFQELSVWAMHRIQGLNGRCVLWWSRDMPATKREWSAKGVGWYILVFGRWNTACLNVCILSLSIWTNNQLREAAGDLRR